MTQQRTEKIKSELLSLFPNKVNFDRIERMLYSHDVGSIPSLIQKVLGNTVCSAIFQPENEQDLVKIVDVARKYNIKIIPRGKATSGYGGVIPLKKGWVIDFTWMNKVIEINGEEQTVTVEPGIVWQDLEKKLAEKDLALRLYPSSAPFLHSRWLARSRRSRIWKL